MKYSIVIVTYNRCDLLKECITCALQQTIAATHIVVIDNACTDDTDRYLNSLSIPQLVHYRLDHNAGGAGGFYEGLKKAHELGDEAHIIIDDDAMLSKDFAEQLLDKARKNPEILAFAGAVKTEGCIARDHRQRMKRPGFRMEKIPLEEYQKESFYCDTASFCGLMIRDEVIARIGYPQKEYFIWYDDTEYCVRIREISQIMVIPAAVLNHKTVFKPMDWPRHYTWKDYYGIRNRMHMVRTHGNLWDYVVLRLLLWTGSGMRNRIFALVHLHHEDWKEEVSIYKRGIRDGKKFLKEKQR